MIHNKGIKMISHISVFLFGVVSISIGAYRTYLNEAERLQKLNQNIFYKKITLIISIILSLIFAYTASQVIENTILASFSFGAIIIFRIIISGIIGIHIARSY
jgi:hypothetical protein